MAGWSQSLDVVQALAFEALKGHSVEEIAWVGRAVEIAVEQFRSKHPKEFQRPPGRGLLGSGPGPRSDFAVARSVELKPAMLSIQEQSRGVPPLPAYILVASFNSSPDCYFDEGAALEYLVC